MRISRRGVTALRPSVVWRAATAGWPVWAARGGGAAGTAAAMPAAGDAQADGFAVFGRHDGDAQVVVFVAGFHGDAAVVGEALFGDVEAGHDLEARDDGGVEVAHVGGDGDGFEDAVHAVTEADGV